jgi:hypothetical protein
MWQEDLACQLSWKSQHTRGGEELPSSRPSAYRAPSWSWASREGSVKHNHTPPLDSLVILEAVVEPFSSADPFGQVISGHLNIRAPLKLADSFQCNSSGTWAVFGRSGSATHTIMDHHVCNVFADAEEEFITEIESRRDVWCLQISKDHALLLVADDEKYRRIGIFFISETKFFEDACLSTITII